MDLAIGQPKSGLLALRKREERTGKPSIDGWRRGAATAKPTWETLLPSIPSQEGIRFDGSAQACSDGRLRLKAAIPG